MPREIVTLTLSKKSPNQSWGFRFVGGIDRALIIKVDLVSISEIIQLTFLKVFHALNNGKIVATYCKIV